MSDEALENAQNKALWSALDKSRHLVDEGFPYPHTDWLLRQINDYLDESHENKKVEVSQGLLRRVCWHLYRLKGIEDANLVAEMERENARLHSVKDDLSKEVRRFIQQHRIADETIESLTTQLAEITAERDSAREMVIVLQKARGMSDEEIASRKWQ